MRRSRRAEIRQIPTPTRKLYVIILSTRREPRRGHWRGGRRGGRRERGRHARHLTQFLLNIRGFGAFTHIVRFEIFLRRGGYDEEVVARGCRAGGGLRRRRGPGRQV